MEPLTPGLQVTLTGLMMINVKLKTMKIMKKFFVILSATLVSLALASCQKEKEGVIDDTIVEPEVVNGVIPFDLNAHIAETKTTLNPSTYVVSWQDNDVLYAVTTDSEWGAGTSSSDASGNNIATFTYNGEKFITDKEISAGSHTFNFIYEGSGQKKFHRASGTTHQLYATQSVDAENPAQNLKANDALVGQITKTIPATLADITLSHLYSLMKVTIKNKLGADVTATKFEIQVKDQNIAGIFDVAFDTPGVTYKSSGTDKITVNITNGSIADNGSIDIFFVMAPVANFTGDVTFTVTDSEAKTYSKTNSVADLTFAAGTYSTANFSLKPVPTTTFTRINSVSELTDGDYKYVIVGQQEASSFGILTYGSLSSGKLTYTKAYSSLPATTVEISDVNSMWSIAVSDTEPKTATLYNESNDKYLIANSALSFGTAGNATSFTVTSESNLFAFSQGSNYLGVNKSSAYWRDYASGTVYASSGKVLALYRYWETSELSAIAISGTYPTSFHQGDAFSYDGLIVRATYANGKTRIVSPTSVTTPDMSSVADDVEVTVSYTEGLVTKTATYTVDITAAATSKTITKAATTNGSFVTSPDGSAMPGETVTVTATPASGYVLASISVVGEDTTPITVTGNTFVMPDQNVTVTVVFGQLAVLSKATFTTAGVSLTTTATSSEATTTIDGISVTYKGVSTNVKNTPTAPGASSDAQKVKTGQLLHFKKSGDGYIYNTASVNLKKVILELTGTTTTAASAYTPTVSAKASADADYASVALPSPVASTRGLDAASGSTHITVNTFVYEIDMTGKNFFKIVTGGNQLNVYSISVIY